MKFSINVLISIFLIACALVTIPVCATTTTDDGSCTSVDPHVAPPLVIEIQTKEDLRNYMENWDELVHNRVEMHLNADIDLEFADWWRPIKHVVFGKIQAITDLKFDGHGHTIKNLPNSLFGDVQYCYFKNLNFENVYTFIKFNPEDEYKGVIYTDSLNRTHPENCKLTNVEYGSDKCVIPITCKDDLMKIGKDDQYTLNGNYELWSDINLNNDEWEPIGNDKNPFKGTFNGNNYTIKNLKITQNHQRRGLFDTTNEATIKNLNIDNVSISESTEWIYVGALVGISESSTIENCTASNVSISCDEIMATFEVMAGGLVGYAKYDNTIENCNVENVSISEISGETVFIGGLVGDSDYSTIENCTASNVSISGISGSVNIGGLVGFSQSSTFENCTESNVSISGISGNWVEVGGLIGHSNGGTIEKCHVQGSISNITHDKDGMCSVGEYIGKNYYEKTSIKDCQADVKIENVQ